MTMDYISVKETSKRFNLSVAIPFTVPMFLKTVRTLNCCSRFSEL